MTTGRWSCVKVLDSKTDGDGVVSTVTERRARGR